MSGPVDLASTKNIDLFRKKINAGFVHADDVSAYMLTVLGAANASAARALLQAPYYEEGTWTPTLFGSTTPGTTTYLVQAGEYTRIGNLVILNARINWTAVTGTGSLRLGGVPFAFTAAVERRSSMIVVYYNGLSLTAGTALNGGYSLQSSSTIIPTKSTNTTSNNGILMTEVPSGEIYFQMIYRVA